MPMLHLLAATEISRQMLADRGQRPTIAGIASRQASRPSQRLWICLTAASNGVTTVQQQRRDGLCIDTPRSRTSPVPAA